MQIGMGKACPLVNSEALLATRKDGLSGLPLPRALVQTSIRTKETGEQDKGNKEQTSKRLGRHAQGEPRWRIERQTIADTIPRVCMHTAMLNASPLDHRKVI